jgi:3-isopropylmalate/(R)-2-methylmalate dehydratase large subunit
MAAWWHGRTVNRRPEEIRLTGRVLYLVDDPELMRAQLAGHDLDPAGNLPLRHDLSTDEITPARFCYHYDRTLGEYPYTGMRAGDEFPVAPGAVRAGGFVASVAGRRRGKGSSREAAPFAELAAGISVVFAESCESVYDANCVNLGMLVSTDLGLAARLRGGQPLPLEAFTDGRDPITAEVVRCGGLFPYNLARLQGAVAATVIATERRPMTLAEKIVASHVRRDGGTGVGAVAPGDATFVAVDLRFTHEYVTPMTAAFWDELVGADVPLTDPGSIVFFRDHLPLVAEAMAADEVAAGRLALANRLAEHQAAFAARTGVRLIDAVAGGGICHTVVLERFAMPGQLLLGTDSHTCQAGALGCLALGCGATEMLNAWFTRDVRLKVPATLRVEVSGTPSADVTAKDVMLLLLAHPFVRAGRAVGLIIEYGGPVVAAMGVEERATLTNMAAEVGGLTGVVEPDHRVIEFLAERRGGPPPATDGLRSDPGCEYVARLELDVAELEPMIATPGDPGNGRPARELDGLRIDIAYGGSCTAGKRSDMDLTATVLRWGLEHGLRAASGVRFFVQCASEDVLQHCRTQGYVGLFERIGAVLLPPSCGACINAGPGVSRSADEVTVSSINRNFPGRSGPGQVYLASPTTVAASALAGSITTFPALRRRHER